MMFEILWHIVQSAMIVWQPRGPPGPMMQPPSSLPNFAMPPPGFSGFSSDSGPSTGGNQTPSDANQELWVETKTGDGKVHFQLLIVIQCYCQIACICVKMEM